MCTTPGSKFRLLTSRYTKEASLLLVCRWLGIPGGAFNYTIISEVIIKVHLFVKLLQLSFLFNLLFHFVLINYFLEVP